MVKLAEVATNKIIPFAFNWQKRIARLDCDDLDEANPNSSKKESTEFQKIDQPIVINADYWLIDGQKRYQTAIQNHEKTIRVFIDDQTDSESNFLLRYLDFQTTKKSFSTLQKAIIANTAKKLDIDLLSFSFCKNLGIQNLFQLQIYQKIGAFSDELLPLLNHYQLGLNQLKKMGLFKNEELISFVHHFQKLKANQNEIMILIELLLDLGIRDFAEYQKLITDESPFDFENLSLKNLRQFLYQKRYPTISAIQKEVTEIQKSLLKINPELAKAKTRFEADFEKGELKTSFLLSEKNNLAAIFETKTAHQIDSLLKKMNGTEE